MGIAFSNCVRCEEEENHRGRNLCRHETVEDVKRELHGDGFENCRLIVGVDFTKSNTWTGRKTFDGRVLHDVAAGPPNPYLVSLQLITQTLQEFDDDKKIHCYGFGDAESQDTRVFSFFPNDAPANGLPSMLARYKEIAPKVNLSGPTTFAPLIQQTMRIVYEAGMRFHMLLILADGKITKEHEKATAAAIVDASFFPISIVMIGVGDGPWDAMRRFDDKLPSRRWDNFQFIEFNEVMNNCGTMTITDLDGISDAQREVFGLKALMEMPNQYKIAKNLRGEVATAKAGRIIDRLPENLVVDMPEDRNKDANSPDISVN